MKDTSTYSVYRLVLAALLLAAPAAIAGSHTAQSGTFSVNTRATTTVKVTGVTSRYCDGPYGGTGRHVYFLAGVGYDFGLGVVGLPVEFISQVDWGGKTGSRLEFNGINNGMSDSRTIDVSALPVGGKLEVVAVASDGARSAPFRANFDVAPKPDVFGVALSAEVSLPGSDQLDYSTPSLVFSPFAVISGSLDLPRNLPGLSGEEMKIAPSFKVSVKVNGNAGTMHVKPAIGAKGDVKINGTQTRRPNGQFGKMAGFEAGLYAEADIIATYKQDKWELSQTYVGIEVDGKFKSPPVYYGIFYGRLDIEANLFVSYQLKALSPSGTPESDFRISSDAMPNITLVAGAGVSRFVEGEISGGGGGILEVSGGPPIALDKLGLKLQIGAKLVVIGYGSLEKDFWTGTYWIKNTELGIDRLGLSSMASPLMMLSEGGLPRKLTALDTRQFQPLGRDYQKRNSMKTLTMAKPMPRLLALTGGFETALVVDGYPYPEPAVVAAGSTNHVLYVRDNAGRLTENRTELVDVFNAGEGWSAAAPVWDDGTGDFSPQVAALSNGTLLAVWANGRAALTNGATLDEALAGLEIAVGERDPVTGAWTCRNLTANAYLDHSPMLSVAPDGSAMTAWIRNRDQNPLGTPDEPNRILFSRRVGGVWSDEDYVAVNLGTVTYCDLAYNGTQAAIVFSMDNDGDLETQGDQEIYGCIFNGSQWGAYVRLTSNAVQDTRPYVRYDAEGQLLVVWYQDGKVMSATGLALTDPVTVGDMGIGSGAQDFKLATGPAGELAIIWPGAGAAGVASPDPYILNYDPQQKLWSRGVRLLEDPALERGFSGAFGADGRLRLAYSKVAISEDANGVPVFGAVDLCVLDHSIGPDPAIAEYGIALSTNSVSVGESVGISVTVENRGDLAVSNLAVCVYEGNPETGGVLLGETQRVAQVLGGTSAVVTVTWMLPDAVSNVVLYAAVDPGLETDDRNRANNTATLAALMPDLSVDGASALNESTNVRLVKASVMNEGSVPVAAGTQVTFRRGASDGALLAEDTLGALVFGTNGVYDAGFRWEMDGTVFTSAFEVVYIAIDPSNAVAEIEERNNTTVVQVMTSLDTDGDGLLDGEEQRLGTRVDLADTDGDGLSDTAEVRTHGTNPMLKDSDGDGSNDAQEIAAGTDPNSATDIFKIVAADGSVDYVMSVTWNAKSGSVYRVEAAPAVAGAWGDAPTGSGDYGASLQTAVSNGVLRYCDTQGGMTNRYYRVKLATP